MHLQVLILQTHVLAVEDLAMMHPTLCSDRSAGMGYLGPFPMSTSIPVSVGLSTLCTSFNDGEFAESKRTAGAAFKQNRTKSNAEDFHQALKRCSNLGLLDVDAAVPGCIRVSCCQTRTMPQSTFQAVTYRVVHKYAASLAHLVCRLFWPAPQAAAAILLHFSDIIWQSLIQLTSKRAIDCLYDIFPLLHIVYHVESIETLLLKAMSPARSMGAAWYAKVCCALYQPSSRSVSSH